MDFTLHGLKPLCGDLGLICGWNIFLLLCCSNNADQVALHCCCCSLFVSVRVGSLELSGSFVSLIFFCFVFGVFELLAWTAGNARWTVAGCE